MTLRTLVPKPARTAVSRLLGRADRAAAAQEVAALIARPGPILAGPWLGEVGFEALYWVPFLRWAVEVAGLPPDRVVAMSRGGTAAWYDGIASQYLDVFDFVEPHAFRAANAQRHDAVGEQKQRRRDALDDALVAHAQRALGTSCTVLHPSTMFRAYQRFFWRHAGPEWVHRQARYRELEAPDDVAGLPPDYIAVKFYANDCFDGSAATADAAAALVRRIAARTPVVALGTGLAIDAHAEVAHASGVTILPALGDARHNLGRQSAVLARARGFVGTYGGFSYLAPFHGTPALACHTDPAGFATTHLAMARSAFETMGAPPFDVLPMSDAEDAIDAWMESLR